MTKPTGRPRGRPKTKEYVTLMARVPQDLAERIQRYAGRKRQTISDVLRDGLLVLLEEEDPYRKFTSDRNTVPSIMSDVNTENNILSDSKEGNAAIASDIKLTKATQDGEPVTIKQAILSDILSDVNGEDNKASDMNRGEELLSDTKEGEPSIMSDTIPTFDPEKFALGKLCPRAHEYHGTGKTLLKRTNRHCMACDREKFHERKQAKRAK